MRRLVPSLLLRAASVQAVRAPPASVARNLVAASARCLATAPSAARPPPPPPPPAAPPRPPPGPPLPAIVDVVDRAQLPALVASSHERPLLLVLHVSGDAACASALQALGDALSASPEGFRLALVEVNELPDVAERLRCAARGARLSRSAALTQSGRVTSVPAVLAMVAEKVTERLSGPQVGPGLQQLVARAVSAGRALGAAAAPSGVDTESFLSAGFEALRSLGSTPEAQTASVRAAVQAFSAVLAPEAAAPAPARARALAGLARAALAGSPPDIVTAKELAGSARQVAAEGPPLPPGTPERPVPAEVTAAEAYISILEDTLREGEAASSEAAPSEADAAAAAAHARALQRFLAGNVDGALEDALWLVRKHRAWRNNAGRTLVLRLADALGPDPRAEKARRRLSNLWFA